MTKRNGFVFLKTKTVLFLCSLLLAGCSGDGGESNSNIIQSDQATVSNPITDDGNLSSVTSTPANDSNGNGIRDVVESSIEEVTTTSEQKESMTIAAQRMQQVIDAHNGGGDLAEAVYEYEKALYCLTILNVIRDEETSEGVNDHNLLQLVTLASTNNTQNFSDIIRPYRDTAPEVTVEECK